jgi:hypothetical protein
MARIPLGDVIAERTYQWHTTSGVQLITLSIGRPVPDPEPGGDWVCPVAFRGGHRSGLRKTPLPVHGIDALQALVLAVGYAQRELGNVQRSAGAQLSWLDGPDLGLPDILGLVGVRRLFRAPRKLRLVERGAPAS